MELKELLLRSCTIMHEYSRSCTNDFLVHNSSVTTHTTDCEWYHSVWQYLRVLDCVSAPQWHQSFYEDTLLKCIQGKNNISILISGTADYSLLHLIISILKDKPIVAAIDVVDLCNSPLKICEWYISQLTNDAIGNCSNIKVMTHRCNITMFSPEQKYDIICTDAFLTRFTISESRSIIEKWNQLLASNGKVITTVRIHSEECNISPSVASSAKDYHIFLDKVKNKFSDLTQEEKKALCINQEELIFMSFRYIVRMKSNNLGHKRDIDKLFASSNLKVDQELSNIDSVIGEIRKTEYYRVVAQKV